MISIIFTCHHQVCDYVGGPVIMKTHTLKQLDLDTFNSLSLSLLDQSLKNSGSVMLSCPDIMFFTRSSLGEQLIQKTKQGWQPLATKHQIQAVKTDFSNHQHLDSHSFNCSEIGSQFKSKTYERFE